MERRELEIGDVVQISPNVDTKFRGCFMLVTDPKPWGAQGFIAVPDGSANPPRAYFRCRFEDMEPIGRAAWAPPPAGD